MKVRGTYAESIHNAGLEGAIDDEHAHKHSSTASAGVRTSVIHALGPGEEGEEREELRLDDQRNVEVLHDDVDAERERRHAPHQSFLPLPFSSEDLGGRKRGRTRARERGLVWISCGGF